MGITKIIGLAGMVAMAAAYLPGGFNPLAQNGGAHTGGTSLHLRNCNGAPQSCLTSVDNAESLKAFVLYRLGKVKADLAAEKLAKS